MPRLADAAVRRGEILDGAFDCFARHGYHALSMRDLARHLGATTGVLYHWFDGKPALFEAMLARQVDRQVAAALAALAPVPPDARHDALAAHLGRQADGLARTLLVALDYHRAQPEGAPLAAALAAYRTALEQGLGVAPDEARVLLATILGELLARILDPAQPAPGSALAGLGAAPAPDSAPSAPPR